MVVLDSATYIPKLDKVCVCDVADLSAKALYITLFCTGLVDVLLRAESTVMLLLVVANVVLRLKVSLLPSIVTSVMAFPLPIVSTLLK